MKKLLLFVAVIFLCATASEAQVKFGIKGGLNIASVDFESSGISISPDSKIGFHAGAMAKLSIAEQFSVQPELLYSVEGATFDFDGDEMDINMNFVNIPVLFTYNPAEIFSIHVGPQIGIPVTAEFESEGQTEDIKDDIKSINLSAAIGAAVELDNGFTGGVRYNLGLSDLNDTEDDGSIKTNAFQVYVGYFFSR